MKRVLPLLLLFVLACQTFAPTAVPPTPLAPLPTHSAQPPATPPLPPPAPTTQPETGWSAANLILHPEPHIYSGDIVSFEIVAPEPSQYWVGRRVSVFLGGVALGSQVLQPGGFSGRVQAEIWWAWDTASYDGEQLLEVSVTSAENEAAQPTPLAVFTTTVRLLPASQRPEPENRAQWARTESVCCIYHYLTHTAAARDIELITEKADAAFEQVEARLGVTRDEKVTFTLLSRLLGHGGFASREISLTYIDRNPAGLHLDTVFIHEGTHILDRQIANERPTILTEGLAVYVAGGHYKPEDLDRRAAAVLTLNQYIPLETLAADFYPQQHEIGYLQAGALVKYLVDTYGWERFRKMYATIQPAPNEAQMLNASLGAHYNLSLAEVEAAWLAHLRTIPVDEDEVENLRLTVAWFDTLRRYQQLNDPSAYYLTAWLPDGQTARERGITADFIRRPTTSENIALETMLSGVEQALERQAYEQAERLLASVNAVLDAGNQFHDPLAAQYLVAVQDLAAQGYEAQVIDLLSPTQLFTGIKNWPELETLTLAGQ